MKKLAGLLYSASFLMISSLGLQAQEPPPATTVDQAVHAFTDLVTLCVTQGKRADPDVMAKVLRDLKAHFMGYPDAFLNAGDFYFRIGDSDNAIRQFQEGIAADGARKIVYQKRIIEVLVRQKKTAEALDLVRDILRDQPEDSEAHALEASFLLDKGDTDAALTELQGVVASAPDNFVAHFNLGRAYFAKGELENARKQFELAIADHPDYKPARLALTQLALRTGDYEAALKYSQDTLKTNPDDHVSTLLEAAALVRKGDFDQARTLLKRLLSANPNDADALLEFGVLNLMQKRYKDAEAPFRKAYTVDPSNLRGLLGVAETYFQRNEPEKAVQVIAEAVQKQPQRADVLEELAKAEFRARQYDKAIAGFQALLDRYKDTPLKQAEVYKNIGVTYSTQGNGQKAIENLQKAVSLAPKDLGNLSTLAQFYDNAGKKQEAISIYRDVLKIDPNNGIVLNNLAYALTQTGGDLDEALAFAQRARQQLPQMNEILDTIGWIYLKKNLTASAIEVFRELNDKVKDSSTFHYHYAMALAQKGDKAGALVELNAALKYHPDKDEATEIRALIQKVS